jgi:hypothetical protein
MTRPTARDLPAAEPLPPACLDKSLRVADVHAVARLDALPPMRNDHPRAP